MRRWVFLMGTSALWFAAEAAPQTGELAALASVNGAAMLPEDQVEALLNHELRTSGVTSQVENGVATLEGIVTSEEDRDRAEQIARAAHGVTQVRNRIVVTREISEVLHAGAPLPPAVDSAVLARLGADTQLAERDIDVRLDTRNAVTLTGEVQSEEERALAGRIAAETPSVTEVRNRLDVRGE